MELILLSGSRIEHALSRATDALTAGEKMSKELNGAVERLRTSRNRLAVKATAAREKEEPPLMDEADWLALL